jgi:membrane protein implicated in regulation of membrane protease activity
VPTQYRFSPALLVRSLGALLVLLGLVVVVVALLVSAADLPVAVLTVTVVLAVLVVVVATVLLRRVVPLVRFDDEGYRVRFLRGAGVKQGRWREVEDAVTGRVGGQDCVVLRLRDGRTTTIPVAVLDVAPATFIGDLRARLDEGHGYRRLR